MKNLFFIRCIVRLIAGAYLVLGLYRKKLDVETILIHFAFHVILSLISEEYI